MTAMDELAQALLVERFGPLPRARDDIEAFEKAAQEQRRQVLAAAVDDTEEDR